MGHSRVVTILRGAPASGKTAFARQLCQSAQCVEGILCVHLELDARLPVEDAEDSAFDRKQWAAAKTSLEFDVNWLLSLPRWSGDLLRKVRNHSAWNGSQMTSNMTEILIIDDVHPRSEDVHRWRRVCRSARVACVEITWHFPLLEVLQRNSARSRKVPDIVVTRLWSQIAASLPHKEDFLLVENPSKIPSSGEIFAMLSRRAAGYQIEYETTTEEKTRSLSAIHVLDLKLRKFITAKIQCVNSGKHEIASTLNSRRKEILEDAKRGGSPDDDALIGTMEEALRTQNPNHLSM
mmetsp:Transcript_11944/g.24327  ORF Transcript_11944/g.24327 Transcript_11944/m.24327 type:complete len:293 (-) Transcript_11944:477-1355(-)